MIDLYIVLIASLISAGAFVAGIYKLFRKRKPLYFQLLICAVGCLALEQLFIVVAIWCNVFNPDINLGMLGLFGCNFFLLSANYGQLDSIIDDGTGTGFAKKTAFIAPVIIAGALGVIFFLIFNGSAKSALMFIVMLIPACPASYFNLKHLLMPIDDFGFLKATRKCNVSALAFYILSIIYVYGIASGKTELQGAAAVMMSMSMLSISVFAIKGAEQWAI